MTASVFHLLVDPRQRARYAEILRSAITAGGKAIIGAFRPTGPTSCSGLPVARYDADSLAAAFGDGFATLASSREEHCTPGGSLQPFTWVVFERTPR